MRAPFKIAAFVAVLVTVFTAAFGVGSLVGPMDWLIP